MEPLNSIASSRQTSTLVSSALSIPGNQGARITPGKNRVSWVNRDLLLAADVAKESRAWEEAMLAALAASGVAGSVLAFVF